MKVGIVTVHSVPNYGAVLQAYALAAHLRGRGVDAETIDYRQPQLEEMYRVRWQFPPLVNHWLRVRRSDAFVRNRLHLGAHECRSVAEFLPVVDQYDAFITGSDQVWFTGPVQYYDEMFFLDFPAPGKRKISYAASAGGTTDFKEFAPRVRRALSEYQHVGVRDSSTAELVRPLSPVAPVEVADPVFLSDFARLLDGAGIPKDEPYLLVFGDFRGALSPALRAIIGATGLKRIVSLQYPCPDATERIAAPSPEDWLAWFRHATFVVTSYFHGTAIAAKFERPFVAIPTPGRRIKVATMLDWMNLRHRCILDQPDPAHCAALARQPIDWEEPRRLIATRTDASARFLEQALA
jgi:hypothetical protein